MKFLNFILLIVLGALVLFAALNWDAIITPIHLNFLFTNASAPLGLVLLSATAILALLFLGFVVYMQSSVLITKNRLNRDLDAQRELANKAETSRFTELRSYLETELQQLTAQNNDLHNVIETRLSDMESTLTNTVEQTGTTLSAYIGELEDRLEKK